MKKTKHEQIVNITMIPLFAALCYIALTVLFIPFANMYIHFGNLIVVLAALLIGGWIGRLYRNGLLRYFQRPCRFIPEDLYS